MFSSLSTVYCHAYFCWQTRQLNTLFFICSFKWWDMGITRRMTRNEQTMRHISLYLDCKDTWDDRYERLVKRLTHDKKQVKCINDEPGVNSIQTCLFIRIPVNFHSWVRVIIIGSLVLLLFIKEWDITGSCKWVRSLSREKNVHDSFLSLGFQFNFCTRRRVKRLLLKSKCMKSWQHEDNKRVCAHLIFLVKRDANEGRILVLVVAGTTHVQDNMLNFNDDKDRKSKTTAGRADILKVHESIDDPVEESRPKVQGFPFTCCCISSMSFPFVSTMQIIVYLSLDSRMWRM